MLNTALKRTDPRLEPRDWRLDLPPSQWHRPLLVLAAALAVLTLVTLVGWAVDDRQLLGVSVWEKPFKFAISGVIYAVTWAWLIGHFARLRRAAWWAGTVIAATLAIGASLASKSAERVQIAGWLSFCKLVLHPLFVAAACYLFFPVTAFQAAVVVSAAALPVAGNVFILAQHYGLAPQRVSAAILISTAASILTVSVVIAWVTAPL